MSRTTLCMAVVAIALSACAHGGPFVRDAQAGRVTAALERLATDSALQRNPAALRLAARLHLEPGAPQWDPERALLLLQQARGYDRRGQRSLDDEVLEGLLATHLEDRQRLEQQVRDLTDERVRLQDALRVADQQAGEQAGALVAQREERELLQRLVTRLEADLRDRESQLVMLRLELDRLKAIDLGGSRPARPPGR
jgi:hypothetical protein